MSFPTKPAFVHHGSWDQTTAQHPAMKWMEEYNHDFDTQSWDSKWYSEDWTYVASDGNIYQGKEKALEAVKSFYSPLTTYFHEPFLVMCSETPDGYEMIGQAKLYANLPGEPHVEEKKVKDGSGRDWDLAVPGAFYFQYAKHGGGFVLKKTEMMGDSGVIAIKLVKRGVIGQKELGL